MITLASAHTRAAELAVHRPGGFAWWYLDLVNELGDGMVLIWGFGLPFLPGIRRIEGPPLARPSLTLSIYRGGQEAFYLFQELPPDEVDWRPESGYGLFGRSLIVLRRDPSRASLDVALDLEVPRGGRLQGKIKVEGPVRLGGEDPGAADADHHWAPILAGCRGSARLDGGLRLGLEGRAYLDHNVGLRPLHALGIGRWSWGRLALPGRELIWYHLSAEQGADTSVRVLEIRADGSARRAESPVSLEAPRSSWAGLSWPGRVRFQDPDGQPVEVEVRPPLDSAPFYHRFLIEGRCAGQAGAGIAELVAPGRLDRRWFNPFVRMRVHRLGGPNSLWLPLFSGPREGRLRRLLRPSRPQLKGA